MRSEKWFTPHLHWICIRLYGWSCKAAVHFPLFQTVFFISEWNAGGGARVCRHAVHLEKLLQSHSSGTQTHVTSNAVTVLRCQVYSQMHARFGLLAHIQLYYQVCHGAEEELNKNGLEQRFSKSTFKGPNLNCHQCQRSCPEQLVITKLVFNKDT